MRKETRAVFLESPVNPTCRVIDLRPLSYLTHESGLALVVDSTFASPINFRPLEHGADVVITSATKYLNGHSDVIAGVVAGSAAFVEEVNRLMRLWGQAIDPHAAWLVDRGMRTLALRMARGVVRLLRDQEKCALVLGMSHLGYYPNPKDADEIGDTQVAAQVDGIDFIASGHTHTFMQKPVVQKTPNGGNTVIFQVGRSGIYVGRVDFTVKDGKVTAHAGRLLDLRDESLA